MNNTTDPTLESAVPTSVVTATIFAKMAIGALTFAAAAFQMKALHGTKSVEEPLTAE